MSYRKITVDGKQYEYVIGASHLKIKAFGLFRNSEIGNQISGTDKYVVTPKVIAAIIRGEQVPLTLHCATHDHYTTKLSYDAYDSEIYGKRRHMIDCDACATQIASCI